MKAKQSNKIFSESGDKNSLSVVGIGASSGGLKEFIKLFQLLPENTGSAYILIQHLDPTHESMLPEILRKHTTMKVVLVENNIFILPDHIYTIPSNKVLSVKNNKLILSDFTESRGKRKPIDSFFISLAENFKENATCIILSGTGTDGSSGLKSIKDHGGLVIVQNPNEAQFDGMPLSAINTELVDHVLSISEISDLLIKFKNNSHSYKSDTKVISSENFSSEIDHILAIIKSRLGHDFHHYKKNTVERRINHHMGLNKINNLKDYVEFLQTTPLEVNNLLSDILINVTSFFRDKETWDILFDKIWDTIIKSHIKEENPIRIWIPGCSTGEEVYTLAILIDEKLKTEKLNIDYNIFATDIDKISLELARQGRYPLSIEKNISSSRINKYFQKNDDFYIISSKLREHIFFSEHNLISDPPFSKIDIISCRNLMIYLDNKLQKSVLNLFHFALKSNGFLILGNSETIGNNKDLFLTINKKHRIFKKINLLSKSRLPLPLVQTERKKKEDYEQPNFSKAPRSEEKIINQIVESTLLNEFAPASVLINRKLEVLYHFGETVEYLQYPAGAPTIDIFSVVRKGIVTKLRIALRKALSKNEKITISDANILRNGSYKKIQISVIPLKNLNFYEGLTLICFQDRKDAVKENLKSSPIEADEPVILQLENELNDTREDLSNTIEKLESSNEELKVSNEEAVSMNEELQSSNEELETSKEELQSLNEELSTVNSQLQEKLELLEKSNNNITNLMNSTNIATIFLDTEMNINFFTPASKKLFRLIDSDAGRQLEDIGRKFEDKNLITDAESVLNDFKISKKIIHTDDGNCYQRTAGPYKTKNRKIEGVILTFEDITELVQKQDLLEESINKLSISEKRLHMAIENSPFPIILHAEDGEILFINKTWTKITGYSHEEIPTIAEWTEKAYKNKKSNVREVINDLYDAKENTSEGEFCINTKYGTKRIWDFRSSPLDPLPDGRKLIISTATDITEIKKMGKEITDSRNKYIRILESVSEGFIALSNDLTVTYYNKSAEKLLGRSKSQVLGEKLFEIFPEAKGSIFEKEYRRAIKEKSFVSFETFFETEPLKNWYSVNVYPYRDGISVFFKIITDKKKTEEELKRNLEQFRKLFHESKMIMLIVDPETGKINEANQFACDFYGYTLEELCNMTVFDINISAKDKINKNIDLALNRNLNFETQHKLSNGNIVDVEIFTNKITIEGKSKLHSIINDITLRKQTEKLNLKFHEQEKDLAIGKMAGKMAHDFNNILGIIMGISDLLLNSDIPEEIQEEIELIHQGSIKGRDMTRNLLFFAKDQEAKFLNFNLNKLINSLIKALKNELNDITVEFISEDKLDNITMDKSMIENAILNLIHNSIHALSKVTNPIIKINAELKDENIFIKIKDNGCGIPDSAANKIFEPSFTLKGSNDINNSYKSDIKGSGYGLANAKKCIEKQGGNLSFQNNDKNGVTFTIQIPLIESENNIYKTTTTLNQNNYNRKKILIVEDEPDYARILYKVLNNNHVPYIVRDGSSALSSLDKFDFDVISLDYKLPDMNGIEVYKSIRKKFPLIPVIFVSGNFEFMQSMIDLKKEDSNVDFISKPFTTREYIDKIQSWCK